MKTEKRETNDLERLGTHAQKLQKERQTLTKRLQEIDGQLTMMRDEATRFFESFLPEPPPKSKAHTQTKITRGITKAIRQFYKDNPNRSASPLEVAREVGMYEKGSTSWAPLFKALADQGELRKVSYGQYAAGKNLKDPG